ncbi:MAG: ethanolamine utilization protein EutM [Hyphomicrobium sp.]|nr:MAG: ethanolamine utilization protein EutM [Hyphomicrobium sp.]
MRKTITARIAELSARVARVGATAMLTANLAACASNLGGDATATTASLKRIETPAVAQRQRPVKIAMLLPLAGFEQAAVVGKAMKQAGEMALFEIDNPAVQLVVKDDKGTAEGAKAAAEEAIKEGAEIILGPLLSRAVPGAASVAKPAGIPVIAFSNDRQVAGNGVYLMSFLVEPEVARVVSYAATQGKRRFAALVPDDAYGRSIEPAFRDAVARVGGSIAAIEFYPVHANGMLDPAKRVMAAVKAGEHEGQPVDALFIPGGPDQLPQLGPLIAYSGVDTAKVKLLGTGAWDYPNIGRDAAFVGGWFAGADPRGFSEFSQRFAKTFGSAPPRIATLAYDAVSLAVSLSQNAPGARYTLANLTRATGFAGIDGTLHFGPNGTTERELAILEVQSFGSAIVDAAQSASTGNQLSQQSRGLEATGRVN